MVFHTGLQVYQPPPVILELKSPPVDRLLCIDDFVPQFLSPFRQQSQDRWIISLKLGWFDVVFAKKRYVNGNFMANRNLFFWLFQTLESFTAQGSVLNFRFIAFTLVSKSTVDSVQVFVDFMFLPVKSVDNLIHGFIGRLLPCAFKNEFHYFWKHLEVALLEFHPLIEDIGWKAYEFVDNFHDVFRVVSILPVLYLDAVSEQKVKFVTFSVVDNCYLWFNSSADPLAAGLRVFFCNVVKNLVTLLVYELCQPKSLLQWNWRVFLVDIFNVLQNIFADEIFCFFFCQSPSFEVVEPNRRNCLDYVHKPIPHFIFKGLHRKLGSVFDQQL